MYPEAFHAGIMGGKTKPTALDFTQDGLIVQFNGIENGGYGVHNEGTIVFKDLIRDPIKQFPYDSASSGFVASDDYVTCNRTIQRDESAEASNTYISDALLLGDVSFESLFYCGNGNDNEEQWGGVFQSGDFRLYGYGGGSRSLNCINLNAYGVAFRVNLRLNTWNYISVVVANSKVNVRINNVTFGEKNYIRNYTRNKVYCLVDSYAVISLISDWRFYGRHLSDSERDTNFRVAKEMFPNYMV